MNLEEQIINFISDNLGADPEEITPEADLVRDLNATNLEISDLLEKIQKEFEITFRPEEVEEIETVGQIIDLVADKMGEFT